MLFGGKPRCVLVATVTCLIGSFFFVHDFVDKAHLRGSATSKRSAIRVSRRLSADGSSSEAVNIILIFVCIICAGLASGLTQGLLALDHMEMTIKSRSGTDEEKMYATQVLPIISRHHHLLVTLMLWNASATEALPIFLSGVVDEIVAIILSVTAVLLFGEIIPASILTGPSQLKIAARFTPLVYVVMFIFFPIAYPISLVLDYFIGDEVGITIYNRKEISTMMNLQHEEGLKLTEEGKGYQFMHKEEVAIIDGALTYREMQVSEVMTPIKDTFMISAEECLSYKTLYEIFKSGYSRIPVFEKNENDIIGLLLAKDLIFVDPEDETPIRNFVTLFGRKPAVVWYDQRLGETLTLFKQERAHMAIVRDVDSTGLGDPVYKVVGIITLEDIIEQILGAEIEDETDMVNNTDMLKPLKYRDMDMARLKLLNTKLKDERLSEEEVRAVSAHLLTNMPQMKLLFREGDLEGVTKMVRRGRLFNMKRTTPQDAIKPNNEDILYRRGKHINTCTLILNGKVGILAGKEEFESERGAWSTLAGDALLLDDGSFVPEFTAFIASENVRLLQLKRADYFAAISDTGNGSNGYSKSNGSVEGQGEGGMEGSSGKRTNLLTSSLFSSNSGQEMCSLMEEHKEHLSSKELAHSLAERRIKRQQHAHSHYASSDLQTHKSNEFPSKLSSVEKREKKQTSILDYMVLNADEKS